MLTFSVNEEHKTVQEYKETAKLIKRIENGTIDDDLVSDSYLQILKGKSVNLKTLRYYKDQIKNYEDTKHVSIIDTSELNKGYCGVLQSTLEQGQYVEFEEESISNLDLPSEVAWFLDMRFKLLIGYKVENSIGDKEISYMVGGCDIWRLTELGLQGDIQAQKKLREVLYLSGYFDKFYDFYKYVPNIEAVASVLS